MHCNEVIRELAVPTDDRDSAALAEHLASCPACAGWAKRDAQFDRLWNATRPAEPSAQAWDTVWAQITSSLDSSTPAQFEAVVVPMATSNGSGRHRETPIKSTSASSRSRPWNWSAIGLIGLAQVAAVLLVVGFTWRRSSTFPEPLTAVTNHPPALSPDASSKVPTETGLAASPAIEIEAGHLVLIRIEDSAAKVLDLTPDGITSNVDDWYLVFNAVEGIANPVIAMNKE